MSCLYKALITYFNRGLKIGGYGHDILHDVTKLHLADSIITFYSIRAFPSKFKKYLMLNMAFVIIYFAVY